MSPLWLLLVSSLYISLHAQKIEIQSGGHNAFENELVPGRCPPAELLQPCVCRDAREKKDFNDDYGVMTCRNISSTDLTTIFERVPGFTFGSLYLYNSSMEFIPALSLKNTSVRLIHIENSTFLTLFDVDPNYENLRAFNLIGVNIETGFEWEVLSNFENLDMLKIENMHLPKLGLCFKRNIPRSVRYIYFRRNGMTRLENEPFEDLNLVYLFFREQKFEKLDLLKLPESLLIFGLMDNKPIETLPDGFFRNLPNLRTVYLDNNSITSIKEEIFSGVPELLIYNNPIDCTCALKWLVTKKMNKNYLGECHSPRKLKGKRLYNLTISDFPNCTASTESTNSEILENIYKKFNQDMMEMGAINQGPRRIRRPRRSSPLLSELMMVFTPDYYSAAFRHNIALTRLLRKGKSKAKPMRPPGTKSNREKRGATIASNFQHNSTIHSSKMTRAKLE